MKRDAGRIAVSVLIVLALAIVGVVALNALADVTVTPRINWVVQTNRGANMAHSIGSIAFDSSYPTGGESLTASDFGFSTRVESLVIDGGCQGYLFQLDVLNQAVQVYYSDDNDTNDGPLIEVPNTTSLSAINKAHYFATGW